MLDTRAETLARVIVIDVNSRFKDAPPTEAELNAAAGAIRESLRVLYPVTDEEYEQVLRSLKSSLMVKMDVGVYITDYSRGHQSWLPARRSVLDFYFWNRYKRFLEDKKGWNVRLTAALDKVSDEIVDLLGDPQSSRPFQRRGLVLGDVQSGKTANYTAVCNKAADTGYKVIVVLAGMTESLRIQTQGRLDAEFAGRKSNYMLTPNTDQQIRNEPFGVGQFDSSRRISTFTSVSGDFNSNLLRSMDLTLKSITEPVLFVVKKNKTVLNNLSRWLISNNADANGKIDLPLLLIDDEADNASVNTRTPDEDPTAINKAIRTVLNRFTKASYLGVTATPFANIFIDPETADDMLGDELFPRDFIYALSPPTDYIGADSIFGLDAPHEHCLEEISDDEMNHFLPIGHKKDARVDSLPPSIFEAIGYFMLANAIRDARGDVREHRSMLINISRYTDVQIRIAELVNEWLVQVRSDLRNYASLEENQSLRIQSIRFLKEVWDKHKLQERLGFPWRRLQQEYLFRAVSPIDVRAVNQRTGANSLDYDAHKEDGLRVIAVGGDSLSRGLTLEGLCVSYFYRRSQMYDTLLQMGRWFGYRRNYADICKIWLSKQTIDWYGYIAATVDELRDEIGKMNALRQTPREFGLRVRQDPNSLIATARNKMRTATMVSRPVTVSGRLLETPRLKLDRRTLVANEKAFRLFVAHLGEPGFGALEHVDKALLWRGVHKEHVVDFLRSFETHPWHLAFRGEALADYIETESGLLEWDVVIPGGQGVDNYQMMGFRGPITVCPQERTVEVSLEEGMIRISGNRVRVGSRGCTRFGLSEDQIAAAEDAFRAGNPGKAIPDSAYLIKDRNPLLMLHVIRTKPPKEEVWDPKVPDIIFAIGLGFPSSGSETRVATYVINLVELRNWMALGEDEEDDYAV